MRTERAGWAVVVFFGVVGLTPGAARAQVVPPDVPPAQAAPAPPAPEPVPVHVDAPEPDRFALHRVLVEGPRSFWSGRRQILFEPVCGAPCDVRLVPGSYAFGVSIDGADPLRVGNVVNVDRALALDIEYRSRRPVRAVGWILLGAAFVATTVMLGVGLSNDDYVLGLGSLGVLVGGAAISLPLIALRDHLALRVRR